MDHPTLLLQANLMFDGDTKMSDEDVVETEEVEEDVVEEAEEPEEESEE